MPFSLLIFWSLAFFIMTTNWLKKNYFGERRSNSLGQNWNIINFLHMHAGSGLPYHEERTLFFWKFKFCPKQLLNKSKSFSTGLLGAGNFLTHMPGEFKNKLEKTRTSGDDILQFLFNLMMFGYALLTFGAAFRSRELYSVGILSLFRSFLKSDRVNFSCAQNNLRSFFSAAFPSVVVSHKP